MSKPIGVLIVATLACGTASAYLWQELRTERQQTRTLQARVAQLEQARSKPPAPQPQHRENSAAAPVTEPVAQPSPTPTKSAPPAAAVFTAAAPGSMGFTRYGGRMDPEMQRRLQENFEQQRRLLQDPEYRALMREQHKRSMKHMYGDMELMLGLSKEEADSVLEVLSEQQLRSMEQQRPFMPPPDGSAPDETAIRERQRALEELQRKTDAELATALGPKYSEWQDYQKNTWARQQVMSLRQNLSNSVDPLRPDQIKPLVQAIAKEQQQMQMNAMRPRFRSDGSITTQDQLRMQEEMLERTKATHQRIRDSVSSLLTPAQLEQLEDQQDQERKIAELNIRTMRARAAEAEARGEDPSNQAMIGVASGGVLIN
jgi:hypothetical protein